MTGFKLVCCLTLPSVCAPQPHLGSAAQNLTLSQTEPSALAASCLFLPDRTPAYFFVTVNKPKAKGREMNYFWPVLSPNLQSPERSCNAMCENAFGFAGLHESGQ